MNKQTKIISVGGSIVIPKTGFDISFLKKFRSLILSEVKRGTKFVLVIGGGGTCRSYQEAAASVNKLTDEDLDWIGIHTTRLNAQFVRYMFKSHAHHEIALDPAVRVRTKKPILVAAGFEPGHSTDTDAVLLAKTYKATELINLSNISYVYDKDPRTHKFAKKIEQIDWASFRKDIVGMGDNWEPGKHAPFDPYASKLAERMKLKVMILDGTDLKQVKKAVRGERFKGTVIW